MKEAIYTIPVTDGFDAESECPFCTMLAKLDAEAVNNMLGAAYMEDDIRIKTNLQGFCQKHYEKLFKGKNALGLAIMQHTHIKTIIADMQKQLAKHEKKGYDNMARHSEAVCAACYICDKIDGIFDRYVDTFFMLWLKDPAMREKTLGCNGFCINHFAMLLHASRQKLPAKARDGFCQTIAKVQLENMQRIEDDLDWFIKKFDYRYKDEPWKNAKDAVARSLVKTASSNVGIGGKGLSDGI